VDPPAEPFRSDEKGDRNTQGVTAKRREFIKGKHLFKNDEFEGVANAKGSYREGFPLIAGFIRVMVVL